MAKNNDNTEATNLLVPIYINEKIVIDMLAIIEDGFSKVSQVVQSDYMNKINNKDLSAEMGTSTSILSKLLKIDFSVGGGDAVNKGDNTNISFEKVHTNTSLLSKFKQYLVHEDMLKRVITVNDIAIGDFIEIEGELQKNPLIDYMDIFQQLLDLATVFSDKPEVGSKKETEKARQQNKELKSQIDALTKDLKHTGTIDFILSSSDCTAVLSAQEQYLSNDNISEMIGGRFKVLGKVIDICHEEEDNIDLLRKTTLSILPDETLENIFSGFNAVSEQITLPPLITKISGPAVMVIPIAIYA